jgi:hypothetical protein
VSIRQSEPLVIRGAIVAAINALLGVLVSFGVPVTPEQMQSLDTFIDLGSIAALVVWSRGKVAPLGGSSEEVVTQEVPEEPVELIKEDRVS